MEQHHTGSLRSLIKSKLFSPAAAINNNQAQSSTQSNSHPQLEFDRDLVIVNRPPSFKKPQQIVSVQVQKPRLKLNNQTRRPISSNGGGPKIFKVPTSNPGLHYGQSNNDYCDVLNITKPLISLPSHTPTSRQIPPAHGSIFIRPTLPQLGSQHLIITPNTHINSPFTPLVLSPTTQNDKSYPTLPSTFTSPKLTTLNNPTDTEPKPVRQKSVRRQTIASSSGLPPSMPAFDLDSIKSTLPLNTPSDPEIRPRSNSADLAEARKIILGLQSQVDIFKQNQQLPPSPPPSNSNKSNHSFGPIRPISPPQLTTGLRLQHSQPSDQTIVTPSSPRNGPNPSLPELQPALCSLLSPNSLHSSSSRPSTAPSSIFEPKNSLSSSRLGSSTSTQSSSASMTTALTASFKASTKSDGTRTRNTSIFSASHDVNALRDNNMTACHELVEQLSTGSSPTTLIGSVSELAEQGAGSHRTQPSQTSQASRTSGDRFDTPEASPTWASSQPTPTLSSAPTTPSSEQLFRPALTVKPLRSQAGRRWQEQPPTDTAFSRHEPKRSVSHAVLHSSVSSITHRTLPSRIRHDRSDSGASALQALFPVGPAVTRPGSREASVASAQRTGSGTYQYRYQQQQHDRTGSVVLEHPLYRPGSGLSETHHRPGSDMSGSGSGFVSPRSRSRLSSAAEKSKIRYDFLDRSLGPVSPRTTAEQTHYSSPEQDRSNSNLSPLPLTLAEARQMSKLELFLLASRHAGELERCAIEKRALLEALRESEKELEIFKTKMEGLEVENARLQTRANGMANELKRAVVDLRSASRIPRRKLSSSAVVVNNVKVRKDEWRSPKQEDEEGSGGSETETETEEPANDDHNHRSSSGLSRGKNDSPDDSEADENFKSIHHRISLSNSSISGTAENEWRLKPEDELFLQDLDDLDFGEDGTEDD